MKDMKSILKEWRGYVIKEKGEMAAKLNKQFGIVDKPEAKRRKKLAQKGEAPSEPGPLTASDAMQVYIDAADKPLPQYVKILKGIASHPDFKKIATAGKNDADPSDEIFEVKSGTAKVSDLYASQAEIGFGNSLDDQMDIPGWSYENAKETGEPPKNPAANALGLAAKEGEGLEMLCPDSRCAIFTFGPVDGKYRIIDGHHRWSQVMMMNPNAEVAIDTLIPKGPLKDTGTALKLIQLAIAIKTGQVVTKPFEGKNLMEVGYDEVYNHVLEKISDTSLELMVKAKKIASPDKKLAAEYIAGNLKAIQVRKTNKEEYTRGGVMPQPADAGTSQDDVAALVNTGAVNFVDPSLEDLVSEPVARSRRSKTSPDRRDWRRDYEAEEEEEEEMPLKKAAEGRMRLTKTKLKQIIEEVLSEQYEIRTPDGNVVKSYRSRDEAEEALNRGTGGEGAFIEDTTQGEYR